MKYLKIFLFFFVFSGPIPSSKIVCLAPHILLIQTINAPGGITKNTTMLYKLLLTKGYKASILIPKNSKIQDTLLNEKLIFHTVQSTQNKKIPIFFKKKNLYSAIDSICKKDAIDIIHINFPQKINRYELSVYKNIAKKYNISLVAQYHDYALPKSSLFKDFDFFTSTSSKVAAFLEEENKKKLLNIKHILHVPPIVDDEAFLKFKPTFDDKKTYFKKIFNIDITDKPVVTCVANLFHCKNHELLVQIAHEMTFTYHQPIHIMFAGTGSPYRIYELNKYATQLQVESYIHFLDFVSNVPELLYYSDAKILCSKGEAFSIALLEAALMKKPIIASSAIDSANDIIIDQKTGLLCNISNVNEFAKAIKKTIDNPEFAQKLGITAYNFVYSNFLGESIINKYINVYQSLRNIKWKKSVN